MMTNGKKSAHDGGRSMTQLAEVAQDGVHLVQQEINLARQETMEKLTPAARSSGMVLGGGVLGLLGAAYLLQAIVRLLATRMPAWIASLLSGGALAACGVLLIGRGGRQLKGIDIVPHKTIKSFREDKEWLLRQIKSRLK